MFHVEHFAQKVEKCLVTESDLSPHINVVDYTVSQQKFQIQANADQSILYTTPRPKDGDLGAYYKSEDYISHTDSKKGLFNTAYQTVRKLALKNKLKNIRSVHPKAQSVLDYGCGTGDFIRFLSDNGLEVFGAEPDPDARQIASEKNPGAVFSTDEILDKDFRVDVITLWHVLEHIPDFIEVLKKLSAKLKPDGVLIIAVPNFQSFDAEHYKEFWAAYDVPRHLTHFSRIGIDNVYQQIGFQKVMEFPMPFDSYYVSLLSEKYKTGGMKPISAFLNGWKSNRRAKTNGEWSSITYIGKKV
jgi:2-polyprenyl-3-methyl-5-hydroxy-6-metoxy-1,4-benzoquinol methylase